LNTESRRRPNGIVSKTQRWQGKKLFLGYEHCDTASETWFNSGKPKRVDQLFDLYKKIRKAGGNLLLDIGPPPNGVIASECRQTLLQLREMIEAFENSSAAPK
jgi:alpha-L-fucosidase